MNSKWTYFRLARGLRREARNWRRLTVVTWLVLHARPRRLFHTRLVGELQVTVRLRGGGVCRCRLNEFYAFLEVFVDREYDVPGMEWQQVRLVVDVGANVGIATLWFARRAAAARVVSVEPAPRAADLLRRNVEANSLSSRVQVREAAIGARCGAGRLRDEGASVTATVEAEGRGDPVEVVSLARLLDDVGSPHVDVLKLDCEGAEFGALLAADATALARVIAIVGEYHLGAGRDLDALRRHLEASGFDVTIEPGYAATGTFRALRHGRGGSGSLTG